jgi:hypothetical protein
MADAEQEVKSGKAGTTLTITGPGEEVERVLAVVEEHFKFHDDPVWTDHPDPEARELGIKAVGLLLEPSGATN